MRHKKLLLVVLLLIALGVGGFFIAQTPAMPLAVLIVGMTNHPGGGVDIGFAVSNQTDRHWYFIAYPQFLSNGSWGLSWREETTFVGEWNLLPHTNSLHVIRANGAVGSARLRLSGELLKKPWLWRLIDWMEKLRRKQSDDDTMPNEMATPPFELTPR